MLSMSQNTTSLPKSGLRWLYVDFNSYFASVEQQLNPALRGKPVAVVPVETDSTSAIAASYEAKAFGVKTGTPIWQAKKMCRGLICVRARHDKYVEFHERIVREVERHIPVTAVCSIDEMASRLKDNETSIEKATEIARSIKEGLAKNIGKFVRCSIGIGPNRYLAKIATDLQKPDGLTVLLPQELPQRLFGLILRDLPGVGRNMEKRLAKAGIHDLPTLWSLDAKQLRAAWGNVWGERMWHLLRGENVPEEETQRRSVGHSHVMAPDLREPATARFVARRLMLKAASRLRRMDYYASALSLSMRLESGNRLEGGLRCYRAQDSMAFLHLLDKLWDTLILDGQGSRIRKVSVTLHELTPASAVQPELFDALSDVDLAAQAKAEKLSRAMDKINQKYGRDSVLLGMLPSQGRGFSGTKIAFTRIPESEEFL
jgi:DNA polymerase-4